MTYLTRMVALLVALLAPTLAVAQSDGEVPTPSHFEFQRFLDEAAFDAADTFEDCLEEDDDDEVGRRERAVTGALPITLRVAEDGTIRATVDGADPDGELQECLDEELEDAELEAAPATYAGAELDVIIYDHTFYDRRRMRHAEIIGLYTLSGVSAGIAVGAFVTARNDDSDLDERLAMTSPGSPSGRNQRQRADRFRAAGWGMVGVSIASFVGGTLFYSANREIERRENPVLVFSPGAPTGDLGFTFSSRF